MNLHLMLMLLSFKEPHSIQELQLQVAPQIVAPLSAHENSTSLKQWQEEIKDREKLLQKFRQQVEVRQMPFWKCASSGNFVYRSKTGLLKIGWWETV